MKHPCSFSLTAVCCQLVNKGKVTFQGWIKWTFTVWYTPVIHIIERHSTDCIHNNFPLVLFTLMSLNCSRLSCQSRLLMRSQASSLPPPWPLLCWSLRRRRWWLDLLVGVWSRLGSPRCVSWTITLSAIKINCYRLMPLTVVLASAVFMSVVPMSIICSAISTFPSGSLQCNVLFPFQALMNHLWFGNNLKEAIAAPVVFVDSQNAAKFEPTFDQVNTVNTFICDNTSYLLPLSLLCSLPFRM